MAVITGISQAVIMVCFVISAHEAMIQSQVVIHKDLNDLITNILTAAKSVNFTADVVFQLMCEEDGQHIAPRCERRANHRIRFAHSGSYPFRIPEISQVPAHDYMDITNHTMNVLNAMKISLTHFLSALREFTKLETAAYCATTSLYPVQCIRTAHLQVPFLNQVKELTDLVQDALVNVDQVMKFVWNYDEPHPPLDVISADDKTLRNGERFNLGFTTVHLLKKELKKFVTALEDLQARYNFILNNET